MAGEQSLPPIPSTAVEKGRPGLLASNASAKLLGMDGRRTRILEELQSVVITLAHGAELGAARARRAGDPVMRARWLAIAAGRVDHRNRLAARLRAMGEAPPSRVGGGVETSGEVARLLRGDLATSHALAARCRRIGRLVAAWGDLESGALLERIAIETLGHAAELGRALALHYAREARVAAH